VADLVIGDRVKDLLLAWMGRHHAPVWWSRGSSPTRAPGVEARACRMMRLAPSCGATHIHLIVELGSTRRDRLSFGRFKGLDVEYGYLRALCAPPYYSCINQLPRIDSREDVC
jgi:hypothetical protein